MCSINFYSWNKIFLRFLCSYLGGQLTMARTLFLLYVVLWIGDAGAMIHEVDIGPQGPPLLTLPHMSDRLWEQHV